MLDQIPAGDAATDESGLSHLTPLQLTAEYLRRRVAFRNQVKRAVRISRGSGGLYVEGNRLAYAPLLFIRICVVAKSIEALLPDCRAGEHWDFGSVASLVRNLTEAYLWYFWLCEDEIDDDDRQSRFILTYCHDRGTRMKMLATDALSIGDTVVLDDLVSRFDSNPYLSRYTEGERREALKGFKTPFVQDDILERLGVNKSEFRLMYRFFSQFTHNTPVSFMRMIEHDRGTGVETAHEKRYMISGVAFAHSTLENAIHGHLKLFPSAETRAPHLTNAQIAANVERNQDRARPLNRQVRN